MPNQNKRPRNTIQRGDPNRPSPSLSFSTREGSAVSRDDEGVSIARNEDEDEYEDENTAARKKVRWRGKQSTISASTMTTTQRRSATTPSATVTTTTTTTTADDEDEDGEREQEGQSDTDDASNQICLAAICTSGRIGAAYFNPARRRLYVLEDTEETSHFDLAKMLLEQVTPDIIFTSTKAEDDFVTMLDEYAESSNSIFQIRPYKEFLWSKGRDRLLSLSKLSQPPQPHPELYPNTDLPPSSDQFNHNGSNHFGSPNSPRSETQPQPRNAYDFMRRSLPNTGPLHEDPTTTRWNASIRLANFACVDDAPLCLGSVGALLDYLVREKALMELDDEGVRGLDVDDIETVALNQVMQINVDALMSLQVFENESHASVHSDKTKEGLSLFGILNSTKTTLGRSLLRTWLMRPSLSASVIRHRHDAVECFTDAENLITSTTMHGHLKGFKNIPRVMRNLKAGKGKTSDWQNLVKFSYHATMLRDGLSELYGGAQVDIVQRLVTTFDLQAIKDVGIKVNEIVDWEESGYNDRVCVRHGIDEELDDKKHIYHGIDSVLSSVAETIAATVPVEFAQSLNVVYFPQLGYLICVPMLDEWRTENGIQPLEGWTFQFLSEEYVYFKSQEMYDMDQHIGDLHSTIVDRELEIIQELLDYVLQNYELIMAACDVAAELDCLLSFAEASRQYEYRRPHIADENVIDIVQGRHPLLERVVDTFVANDTRLVGGAGVGSPLEDGVEGDNSILLCTGANACGKSVYLKQVALIQILAQIGCFVPAQSATLGLVDKLFTRVSTRESVSKVQSAFLIDLAQVSLALRNCTSRSLILLDEFGKGTLSTDGAGLFCGVLHHLLQRGADCPKVLAATHFHDVFHEALLDPTSLPVSFCHMQILFTSGSGTVLESSSRAATPSGRFSTPIQETSTANGSGRTRNSVGSAEKITYLYRVVKGISLQSHAARCAEMFGIPTRVVERAEYVSQLVSSHQLHVLLDEEMGDEERADLADAEAVCRRFLAWDINQDLESGEVEDVKIKLARVLGIEDE